MSHRRSVPAVLVAVVLSISACSGSDDSDAGGPAGPPGSAADETTTTTEAEAPAKTLRILVSNDDSYAAPGIDALVEGLQTLDAVEVTVVAPLDERSGSGGKSTEGELAVTDVETVSGYPAKAVDGFPADTIRVAIEELGVEPDLVVSGINSVQNLGPFVDVSGTVGAARAGAVRDIPALAASQGAGDPIDYEAAVPFVLDWITEHREALVSGDEPAEVTNLNVPSCATGEVRGLAEVETDPGAPPGDALAVQDCTSTAPVDDAVGDVEAFLAGYATISPIPSVPG